jgi:hypothetical protein
MTRERWAPTPALLLLLLVPGLAAAQQARPIEVRPARAAPVLGPLEYQVGSSIV